MVDEVEREIGHELPRGDFETISGMLIDHLKDLPKGNQNIRIELPKLPSDLIQDEPVTRWLYARVVEVEHHVPTLVELSVEVTSDDVDAQEGTSS